MKYYKLEGNETSKKEFVKIYSKLYTSEDKEKSQTILGNNKFTPAKEKVEDIAFAALKKEKPYLTDKLDQEEKFERIWKLIAWKAGRLEYIEEEDSQKKESLFISKDEKYTWSGLNERGKPIGEKKKVKELSEEERLEWKNRIKDFINEINGCELFKEKDWTEQKCAFREAYETLIKLNEKHKMDNLGTVYTIALIYFLSKGKFPIYDQFAHIAAKAIYLNADPSIIYIGDPPGKTKAEEDKVIHMYNEYCWLLQQIFGSYSFYTDRSVDQALWVYGHSKIKYKEEIKLYESNDKEKEYRILGFLKDQEDDHE